MWTRDTCRLGAVATAKIAAAAQFPTILEYWAIHFLALVLFSGALHLTWSANPWPEGHLPHIVKPSWQAELASGSATLGRVA
jgi:hypothetical protein